MDVFLSIKIYEKDWIQNLSKAPGDSTKSGLLEITEEQSADGKKYLKAVYFTNKSLWF